MDHALHHVQEPSRECSLDLDVIAGHWPAGISGHVFIIGPSQPSLANFVWSGTGIITRVDLQTNGAGKPHWLSKRVTTPDTALVYGLAQGVDPATFGSLLAGTSIALTNTSPHFFGDRLILTFDMQRPAEFDPVTLEFKTYIGARAEYPAVKAHPVFPEILTTAHPVEDLDDKCLWFCNVLMRPVGNSKTLFNNALHVVRWDGKNDLETWYVPGALVTQGIHEVTVTRDYIVFTEVGFQHELSAMAGRGRQAIHPPYTDIYIVAKKDLTAENRGRGVPHARARVPYESFHEFADYAQDGEDITLYIAHSNGWDINYAVTEADTVWRTGAVPPKGLHGFLPTTVDASPVGRYVINGRTGEVKDKKLFIDPKRHWATLLYTRDMRPPALQRGRYLWQAYWGCDPEMLITRIVEMYRDHPYRVVPVEELPKEEIPSTLVCLEMAGMSERSSWAAPLGTFVQSPAYVPDEHGGDGWVVAFLQHRDKTELLVFDALDLAKGPVAVASAPGLKQSFQVHSGYLAEIKSRDAGYRRSFAADLGDGWRALTAEAQRVIEPVIKAFA